MEHSDSEQELNLEELIEARDEVEQESDDEEEYTGPGEQESEKPSKDELRVAKWMKKNIKTKKTKFLSHNVEYFTANKALDALMKSKFAEGDEPLFTERIRAVEFLDIMLEHKFFHRAKKVPVTVEELRGVTKSKKSKDKEDRASSKKSEKDETKDTEAEADASGAHGGGGDENEKKEQKPKRKIRLDMHPEQIFVDGSEAYVWIYDPIPIHYWIYGMLLVLGAIGLCLFPLWPPMLRKGVYYLSLAAAGFLVFILALTVVRLIIFTIVWAITRGKLHFWIFPNLTEDVGFFASFWPLYESKYVTETEKTKSEKRSKSKKKKEKESDNEDDAAPNAVPLEPEKIEEVKEHDADAEMELRKRLLATTDASATSDAVACAKTTKNSKGDIEEEAQSSGGDNSEVAAESDAKCSHTPSESESEISGKDYEIISTSEVQNVN